MAQQILWFVSHNATVQRNFISVKSYHFQRLECLYSFTVYWCLSYILANNVTATYKVNQASETSTTQWCLKKPRTCVKKRVDDCMFNVMSLMLINGLHPGILNEDRNKNGNSSFTQSVSVVFWLTFLTSFVSTCLRERDRKNVY